MTKAEADALIATIRTLVNQDESSRAEKNLSTKKTAGPSPAEIPVTLPTARTTGTASGLAGEVATRFDDAAIEKLYQAFKQRFIEEAQVDPTLLHLIMVRPELVVQVEPRVVQVNESNTKGRIAKLLARQFFAEAKTGGAVRRELARTGSDPGGAGTLYNPLTELVRDGFLTKEGDGFRRAPGVKISERTLETVGAGD